MWNRKFKCETMVSIYHNGHLKHSCKDIRGAKNWIYNKGIRNNTYQVDEFNMEGEIINQWLYKYLDSGIIFTKKIYDKWKEKLMSAQHIQESLPWDLPY
jgi:arsenate reductase-like glutaredoxin family protein